MKVFLELLSSAADGIIVGGFIGMLLAQLHNWLGEKE